MTDTTNSPTHVDSDAAESLKDELDRTAQGSSPDRFSELLNRAINIVTGDNTLHSVGIAWMRNSWELRRVSQETIKRTLLAHAKNPHIVEIFGGSRNLTRCLASVDAAEVVYAIGKHHPMPSINWLEDAVFAGVNAEVLAELIKDRTHDRCFDPEVNSTFVEEFIRQGSGRVFESQWSDFPWEADSRSIWSAVGEHLKDILTACAKRQPELFFVRPAEGSRTYDKVRAYLGELATEDIMDVAAERLTTFEHIDAELLRDLSVRSQLKLARRKLPGSLGFLLYVMYDPEIMDLAYGENNPLTFDNWRQCAPANRANLLEIFCNNRGFLEHPSADNEYYQAYGVTPPSMVYDQLVEAIRKEGYVLDTAANERIPGSKHLRQVVKIGAVTYVHSNDLSPREPVYIMHGDTVVVDTIAKTNNRPGGRRGDKVYTQMILIAHRD